MSSRAEGPVSAARSGYDRVAFVYDLAEDPFERRPRRQGLALLVIRPGERVQEIGPGTGHALVALASAAGPAGQVIGVDLSGRMLGRARQRAARVGCRDRVWLAQGDAHRLPLAAGVIEAVFMSFVLELIGTAQILVVPAECHRVLAPGGISRAEAGLAGIAMAAADRGGSVSGGAAVRSVVEELWRQHRGPVGSPPAGSGLL